MTRAGQIQENTAEEQARFRESEKLVKTFEDSWQLNCSVRLQAKRERRKRKAPSYLVLDQPSEMFLRQSLIPAEKQKKLNWVSTVVVQDWSESPWHAIV